MVTADKAAARKRIEAKLHLRILVNGGDQLSDLDNGAFAVKAVRMPNPFHFVP